MSYTKELTAQIIAIYQEDPTRDTVDELAIKHERSVKSIIGKLSKEGVYRREVYVTKTGDKPVTKLELVGELEVLLDIESLEGLEKSPKPVLVRLLAEIKALT
jgi:hypothetical protein